MSVRCRLATLAATLLLGAVPALAQPPAAQDSTLDNLVHEPGYRPAPAGTFGRLVERGQGDLDVVMVSGFGVGTSAFDGFMRRNHARYHMLALTLPGFEGTAAPPMPPPGTSYGAQTWTRGAADALVKLITHRRLDRPVLVGHSLGGTQVVVRVALEHPELVGGVVLLAGSPRYEPVASTPAWPRGLTLERKVRMVDEVLAPRWFRTVTRDTWVKGNFKGGDYSVADSALGEAVATRANAPPLPVLVRWLCEFHASDLWPDLDRLGVPLLVLRPGFTPALRADPARAYLQAFFEEPWRGRLEKRPGVETAVIDRAGILLLDDRPDEVDKRIAEFIERVTR